MNLRILLPILALSTQLVMAEPETDNRMFGEHRAQDFLTDYSGLPKVPDDNGAFVYRAPGSDLGKYNKVLVDRIKIWFKEDSEYKGIDPDELKVLTDYCYSAIEKAFGEAYPMVTEPGPDVLRLRIAVTDLVPNKPEASVTSLIVPYMWIGEAGAGAAKGHLGSTPFTGEATIEFEALDSMSSKQLVAYIETRAGKKYAWDEGVTEGVSSYLDAYSKWEYTKKAADSWALMLRQRLDEAHGKTAGK